MKIVYLLALTMLLAFQAFSQFESPVHPVYYEKGYVYLKNGSVLKGKYLYSDSMEKLRLISGRNTWIFSTSEIDKVSKTKPGKFDQSDNEFHSQQFVPPKWFILAEMGVLAGHMDNSQTAPLVFGSSVNWHIIGNLSAGVGIGAEFLKETYMPATANLLYKFRNSRFTPFGMIQSGYQIPIDDSRPLYREIVPDIMYSNYYYYNPTSELKAKGGLLVNPSLGFMLQPMHGLGMSMAFGYRFHRLHYKGKEDYRLDIDYNRFSVKLGLIFN